MVRRFITLPQSKNIVLRETQPEVGIVDSLRFLVQLDKQTMQHLTMYSQITDICLLNYYLCVFFSAENTFIYVSISSSEDSMILNPIIFMCQDISERFMCLCLCTLLTSLWQFLLSIFGSFCSVRYTYFDDHVYFWGFFTMTGV